MTDRARIISLACIEAALATIGAVLWLPVFVLVMAGSAALLTAAFAHDYIFLPLRKARERAQRRAAHD